tara:strand:+ start:227 stop:406 length:180 start_codon:yes stop_codon:yes gene_type:complete
MYKSNIKNIINYLNELKKYKLESENIINILIDLLKNQCIKEFLRRYDIFINDIKKKISN